jgi:hypothetical protein
MSESDFNGRTSPTPETPRPFVVLADKVSGYHNRLIAPRLLWFNENRERAELLRGSLTPSKSSFPSLRLVDHLVVQYARHIQIMVTGEAGVGVDLWNFYRRMLSAMGKKHFDIFRRKHPVKLRILGEPIQATIGQITFLQWYFRCGLHEYMKEHEAEIKQHMKASELALKLRKQEDTHSKKTRTASRPDLVKPLALLQTGNFSMNFN